MLLQTTFSLLAFIFSLTFSLALSLSTLPLDAVYAIGMQRCEQRWKRIQTWAHQNNLPLTPIYATAFDSISLHQPPIPISHLPATETVLAGQVGCTTSHIRAWRHAFVHNFSHVMILEDDVTLTDGLLGRLAKILADVREGSQRRNWKPWHFMFLRMQSTAVSEWKRREVWFGEVNVAVPGWGTAAYIVSDAGVRYLLTRVTRYSYPLDVQIERLQRGFDTQGAQFIALDVCDVPRSDSLILSCPENVQELPLFERGKCYYSASQMGKAANGSEFPGAVLS